jgi:hypothetical protein
VSAPVNYDGRVIHARVGDAAFAADCVEQIGHTRFLLARMKSSPRSRGAADRRFVQPPHRIRSPRFHAEHLPDLPVTRRSGYRVVGDVAINLSKMRMQIKTGRAR